MHEFAALVVLPQDCKLLLARLAHAALVHLLVRRVLFGIIASSDHERVSEEVFQSARVGLVASLVTLVHSLARYDGFLEESSLDVKESEQDFRHTPVGLLRAALERVICKLGELHLKAYSAEKLREELLVLRLGEVRVMVEVVLAASLKDALLLEQLAKAVLLLLKARVELQPFSRCD